MTVDTEYANTDLDLKSVTPFDVLKRELDQWCCVLHYTRGENGHWHSIVESTLDDAASKHDASSDILAIVEAIKTLSPAARAELDDCYLREFNIGFHCGDTWSYIHTIPSIVIRGVADIDCSISVTLYPMRNPDGTLRE